ncbi:hypothetical protein D3C85_1595620 [compost metagenome]
MCSEHQLALHRSAGVGGNIFKCLETNACWPKKPAPLGLPPMRHTGCRNYPSHGASSMYFEIYRQSKGTPSTGKGQWRWRLRAGNHETIASGESYVNKADCLHAIGLIKGVEGETPVKEI